MYLYWIVSDVVEARNLVMRILTMLKRKMKFICEHKNRAIACNPMTRTENDHTHGIIGPLRPYQV